MISFTDMSFSCTMPKPLASSFMHTIPSLQPGLPIQPGILPTRKFASIGPEEGGLQKLALCKGDISTLAPIQKACD